MRLIACLVACIPLCASESWGDGVVSFSSLTDSMGETIQARVQFVKSPADAMLLEQIIADIQTLLEDQSTSTINVARLKTLVDEAIDPMKGNLLQGGVSLFGQTLLDRFVIWKNEIDYHHQIIQSGNGVNNGIDVGTTSNERINISALGGYGVPIIQEMVARQASNRSTPPRSFSVPAVVVMTTQGTTTRWPSSMDFQRNYSPGWFNAAGERRGYSAGTSWIGELAFPITPGSATVGTIIQVVLDPDQKTLVQSATSSPFAIVGRSFRTYAPSGATRIETTMGRNVVWASDNQRGMFTDGSQELPKDQGERDRILLPIATGIAKMSDNDNQERSYRFDRRLPSFYNRVKDGLLKQNINWLKAYDVNANGYIEDTEMQIFVRDKNQGLIRAAEQVVIRSGMSAFTAADLNGDGKLSVSELAAIGITPLVESTEVIDLWMDPIAIQRGDMYTMAVRTQAPDLFNHYDQINAPNGKIDIVEYEVFRQDMENGVIGYTMALTGAQRTSADTNADGLISASEYSAYRRSVLVASITSGWNSTIASIIEMHDNTSGVSATDEAFYDQAIDQNLLNTTASAMQRYPSRWTIYDRDGDGLVSGDELRIADVTESARATLYGPEIITWLGTQLDANANGVIDGSEITTFDNLTTSGDWSRLSETMRLLTGISGGTVGTFSSLDGQTSALQQRLISEDELAYVQATYALRSLPGTGGPVTDGDRVAMAAGGGSDVFITTPSELAAWTSGMDDGSVSRLVACRNMMNSTVTNQILALYPSITGGNTSQKLDKLAILFAGTGFMNEVESTRFSNTKTLWSAEVERPGAFAAYDTNSDGMISPSEFTVYQNQRQGSTGFYAP